MNEESNAMNEDSWTVGMKTREHSEWGLKRNEWGLEHNKCGLKQKESPATAETKTEFSSKIRKLMQTLYKVPVGKLLTVNSLSVYEKNKIQITKNNKTKTNQWIFLVSI
jgi:hypothetical protein